MRQITTSGLCHLEAEMVRAHPLGREAVVLGTVNGSRQGGLVAMRTALGATRVVDTQVGEQLPRIC